MNKLPFFYFLAISLLLFSCNSSNLNLEKLDLVNLKGDEFNFDKYAQKNDVVFLHFWATWCPPCRAEMPLINSIEKKMKRKGMKFVLISDEEIEIIQKYESEKGYKFNYLKSNKSIKYYGIFSIPHTFILQNGKVVESISGEQNWTSEENLAKLNGYLEK